MCSGAVAPVYILEAFQRGADGVFVGGCHPQTLSLPGGELQNIEENLLLKKLLPQFGIEPERLRQEWVSAAEGQRFAQVVVDFVEEIRKLGPCLLRGDAYELAKVSCQAGATYVQGHE